MCGVFDETRDKALFDKALRCAEYTVAVEGVVAERSDRTKPENGDGGRDYREQAHDICKGRDTP